MSYRIEILGEGAQGIFVKNSRFNTTLVSFHFYLPLTAENIASDALLPYVLTTCSNEFKDYSALNIELLRLYGAELSCAVSKNGDSIHLRISISVINDKFAFDNESVVKKATDLLISLIFNPSVTNDMFSSGDLKREKRKTIERIQGEINDKRSFSKTRLLNEMFKGDPYGIFIYGTEEEVLKIDEKLLYFAWQRLLLNSFIRVNVIGKELPSDLFKSISEKLKVLNRVNINNPKKSTPLISVSTPNKVTEYYDVTQGKLTMGFSSELYGQGAKSFPLLLAADIFGGGPYSRLFTNVREKQSLCYYCSASATRNKGYVIVSSGVDGKNVQRLEKAVLKELVCVQNGEFDEFVLTASKKSITDSLGAYYDNPVALDFWYATNSFDGEIITPESAIDSINKIAKDEIVSAAKGIKLHTVYSLLSKEE